MLYKFKQMYKKKTNWWWACLKYSSIIKWTWRRWFSLRVCGWEEISLEEEEEEGCGREEWKGCFKYF